MFNGSEDLLKSGEMRATKWCLYVMDEITTNKNKKRQKTKKISRFHSCEENKQLPQFLTFGENHP